MATRTAREGRAGREMDVLVGVWQRGGALIAERVWAKVKFRPERPDRKTDALGAPLRSRHRRLLSPGLLQRAFICLSSFRSPHLLLALRPHLLPRSRSCVPASSMPVSRDPPDRDPLSAALRPPIDETEEEKASRIAEEEAAKRVSHAIDEAIRLEKQQRKKHKLVRLLLLGQSESGPFRVFRRVSRPHINPSFFRQIHHPPP